jgi:hydrogenase-4 component F
MLTLALALAAPWLAPVLTALIDRDARHTRSWFVAGAASTTVLAAVAAAVSPDLDAVGRLLILLVAVVGALAVVASGDGRAGDDGADPARRRSYFLWLTAFWWSLLLLAVSRNLGLAWIAIELTTVTSAVLVAISGRRAAVEAAWKYVILCSVGLLVALLGIVFLLALGRHGGDGAPTLAALDFTTLRVRAATMPAGAVRVALILITVGLGTKIGFAPMHTWLPDAHSEAPAPVSGLLSGVLLAMALVVLWRVDEAAAVAVGAGFPRALLIGFGLVSVAVATPFLLLQLDIKRLLAYSSIEQLGVLAIAFGTADRLAVDAAFVQLVVHALVKAGLFFVAGDVLDTFATKHLARATGLVGGYPRIGYPWLVGMLTLAGLPPFPMFLTEVAIVFSLFAVSPWLGGALLGLLAVLFVGLAHATIQSAFGRPPSRPPRVRGHGFAGAIAALALAAPVGLVLPLVPRALHLLVGGVQ